MKKILKRYAVATIGLLLVAIGVALGIVSNLGIGPLSVPSYVLEGIFGLSVGNWVIIVNASYILIQILLLGKSFKASYLLQLPASVIFGYLIDLSLICLSWLHPLHFSDRIVLIVMASVITAFGVSIEVLADGWMLSAEMTVYAITQKIPKPFGEMKVLMDCSILMVGCVISFFLHGNLLGKDSYEGLLPQILGTTDGVVVGLGTLLMAILPGWMMKYTTPVMKRFFAQNSSNNG